MKGEVRIKRKRETRSQWSSENRLTISLCLQARKFRLLIRFSGYEDLRNMYFDIKFFAGLLDGNVWM